MIRIEPLSDTTMNAVCLCEGGNGWKSDPQIWSQIAGEHNDGVRHVLIAMEDDRAVGYGSLLWRSGYPPFAASSTPELHDIATARMHRRRGIATALIDALEARARHAGHRQIGLGVGLYADYGPAQRLYSTLGYRPDGNGATYRSERVAPGVAYSIDDDLLIWMVKSLGPG